MIGPLVLRLDPETAHGMALWALKFGLVPGPGPVVDPILECHLWGMSFPSPIGLAAGFDKNAEIPESLFKLGFGFVECGTVTPKPQPGNSKPRMFRLKEDGALINRLGFNNQGLEVFCQNLARRKKSGRGILGVNIGQNKETDDTVADYVAGVEALADYADYLVINISSPNTPGLRDLQGREKLQELLAAVIKARDEKLNVKKPPLLLKVAPDLDEEGIRDIADIAVQWGIDGIVATNTTIARPEELSGARKNEAGGLSGRPLLKLSTRILSDFYRLTEGKIPLIGVGGVASGRDAYEKIIAGASLVQFYTGMIFGGPGLARKISLELAEILRAEGFSSVSEAIGAQGG